MAEIVRISRDKSAVLIRQDGRYYQEPLSLSDGATMFAATRSGEGSDTLSSATTSGSWRRPTAEEKSRISFMAEKPTKKNVGRTFRVPPTIQASLSNSLEQGKFTDPEDVRFATELSSGKPASSKAIEWLKAKTSQLQELSTDLGGDASANWVQKFNATKVLTAAGLVPEEGYDYYGLGDDPEKPEEVRGILIVDSDDTLYTWADGALFPLPDTLEDYEAPSILEISDEDAVALASWLDDPEREGEVFILTDIDPEERNLVDLAFSEIDWEEIDRLEVLTADATGYSPAERSENATRQQRANDGRFGGPQTPRGETLGAALAKARLETPLPLVLDPASRIESYLAGTEENATPHDEAPVVAAGEEVETEAAPETETLSGDQPLYFAIVDPVDNTAVLDVVSITPDDEGQASAWKRSGGEWTAAPELLADLQGDTPPPVVELDDSDVAKNVLAQVDEYDASGEDIVNDQTITASAAELTDYSKKQRDNDAKKGIALPDGSYPIRNTTDLQNAVKAFGRAPESKRAEVKKHIKKRAKALNRNDLVPADWKETSIFDDDHLSPIYGEFGEIVAMVAAAPGVGNAERLRQYWSDGKGAAKIRWGTEGDLTRCHRQLSKYMPGRAWGYCQNLHQRKFGVSNATRDKAGD